MSMKTNRENGSLGMSDKDRMVAELRAKLEWYTKEATAEEFDPKAVESILYLLDIYEPLKEEYINVEDAWERFEKRLEKRDKLEEKVHADAEPQNRATVDKVIRFVRRQKGIVAAILIILVLALVGTTRAEAIRQGGFFFWLRQDEEGRQMLTSPENLESALEKDSNKTYYEWCEVPKWCLDILCVDEDWQENNLEWKYIDVIQFDNYKIVKSCYTTLATGEELVVGAMHYNEKVSLNTEVFGDYSYVESYKGDGKSDVHIYSREDKYGTVFYRLCRFADSEIYFMEGVDLVLLQDLIKEFEKK